MSVNASCSITLLRTNTAMSPLDVVPVWFTTALRCSLRVDSYALPDIICFGNRPDWYTAVGVVLGFGVVFAFGGELADATEK
jgi:hypothetical protein